MNKLKEILLTIFILSCILLILYILYNSIYMAGYADGLNAY